MSESINNIQGYSLNKPSSKVTQAPGGNSSISFGDYQNPAPQQQRQIRDPNKSQFTLGGEAPAPQKQQQPQPQQQYPQAAQQQAGQQQNVHTSVKVKNPPGGQSSIQFG